MQHTQGRSKLMRNALKIAVLLIPMSGFLLSFNNCSGSQFKATSDTTNKSTLSLSNNNTSLACSVGGVTYSPSTTVSGFPMSSVVYPVTCGNLVTRTCLPSGQFNGSVPLFQNCSQQCLHPDNNSAVNSGFQYVYFTKSSGSNQADCDNAKVVSSCSAGTGTFLPTIAAGTRFPTCLVAGQTCAYTSSSGTAAPSGYSAGSTVMGFPSSAATFPALCGATVSRSCQASGQWTGTIPLYTTCTQKCIHPDSQMPTDAGTNLIYYTISSGTQSQCDAAKVTSTCQAQSGTFSPVVPAATGRFASCTVSVPSALMGKDLYDAKCMACHGALDVSTKRDRSAAQITNSINGIAAMAPLKGLLTTEQVASLASVLASGTTSGGRYQFSCNPNTPIKSNIDRLSNRSYSASITAVLNEINTALAKDSQLVSYFSQLPSDVVNGTENTINISTNLISLHNDIAFRIGSLLSTTYIGSLPGTSSCLTQSTVTSSCISNFINNLGRIVLRRSLAAAELSSLTALYNNSAGSNVASKVNMVVAAIFQAPDFMYQIYDRGSTLSTTNQLSLNAQEYASKLSLLITGTGPDAQLRTVADNGTLLTDPTVLSTQVDRLLTSSLGKSNLVRFYKEWMQYDRFDSFQYTADVLNGLAIGNLKTDAVLEIDNFVTDITINKQTFNDLLNSNSARFNSSALAAVYGISNPNGATTTLPTLQRSGLLSRAAFLTKRSGGATSPVLRGKFVLTQILCSTIGSPPPDAPPVIPPLPTGVYHTTRERVFNQTEQPGTTCVACHNRMNNLGYPFEVYDSLGRYRQSERIFDANGNYLNVNLPVVTSATSSELGATTVTANDGLDLSLRLGNNDKALACMTQKWQEFQVRRTATSSDYCQMNDSLNTLYGSGSTQGSIYDMIKKSIQSSAFKTWGF